MSENKAGEIRSFASLSQTDVRKIDELQERISTQDGKNVILVAYED